MFDENVRTDKDAIETDGIVLDLFVKVIQTTRNTIDVEILTRQLANIVSSSPRESFSFQLLSFRSLCLALSVVSVSSRGGSKSRAEGASAAAFDILAKVTSSASEERIRVKEKVGRNAQGSSKQCSSRHSKTDRIRNKEDLACNKI